MEEEDLVFVITIRLLRFSLEITVVMSDDPAFNGTSTLCASSPSEYPPYARRRYYTGVDCVGLAGLAGFSTWLEE